MSATRTRRPSPGRIDLIRLPRTPTRDINVENNSLSVRASLERHALFDDAESFTVLAQRETEAALSRHLQQEQQLERFRSATLERLQASCVKYDEVDVKQESLSRRQVRFSQSRAMRCSPRHRCSNCVCSFAFASHLMPPPLGAGAHGHITHTSERHSQGEGL
jgi:hypothetical protein